MKSLAIINHYSSAGGGARFLRSLVFSLAKNYPNLKIGIFIDASAIERDALPEVFNNFNNIEIYPLYKDGSYSKLSSQKFEISSKESFFSKIKKTFKKSKFILEAYKFFIRPFKKEVDYWYRYRLKEETINKLNSYDVIYLAWHYFLEPVEFIPPVISTFHDFNYKYFPKNFDEKSLHAVNEQFPQWLKICSAAIVSTPFIKSELEKFFYNIANEVKIIYLAPFNITFSSEGMIEKTKRKFNLPKKFIISPNNTSVHKNLKKLIIAAGLLKKKNIQSNLVLAGHGTDNIIKVRSGAISEDDSNYNIYKDLSDVVEESHLILNKDIYPLGYVSDQEIDALIKGAELVISPSLYEAGSGPGLDAWKAGTPVAFSNISPFLEQMEFLKTKAWVFDPEKPEDIALKIAQALREKDRSLKMAEESKEAIDKYTWDDVAKGYYEVFQNAHNERRGK